MAGLQSPQDDFEQQKRDAAAPGQATQSGWQQPRPDGQAKDGQPKDGQPKDGQQ